jgi:hypothetical protein
MPGLSTATLGTAMALPRIATVAALSLSLAASALAVAQADTPRSSPSRLTNSFDSDSVKAKLEAKGTPFTVDEDGDFSILVDVGDGRTQQVWVLAKHESGDHVKIREIWSPGFESETDAFPADLANDLLERSHLLKLGSWVKQGRTAMLVAKIPAHASANELDEAIDLAAATADALELELTGKDDL